MIRERRGKYQVRVYAGTIDGKRNHLTATAPTYADAKQLERDLANQVRQGRNASAAKTTVDDLFAQWLRESGPDLSPKTLNEYEGMLRRHIKPALGATPIGKVTTARLDRFYAELRDEKGLDPQSIAHVHALLRKAFNVSIRKEWLIRNPTATASPPKVRRKNFPPPEPDIVKAFLDGLPLELHTYARVAAVSDCRRGELCGLRWSDLALVAVQGDDDAYLGVVTVQRSLVDLGHIIEKGTKTDRVRTVTLDPGTVELLNEHRDGEEEKARLFGVRFSSQAPIFTTDPGQPWRPDLASHRIRRAALRAGVKGMTLQALRRWAITNALHAGHSVRQVADRAGHADGSLVLSRYGHAVPAADAAIAESLGALLDGR